MDRVGSMSSCKQKWPKQCIKKSCSIISVHQVIKEKDWKLDSNKTCQKKNSMIKKKSKIMYMMNSDEKKKCKNNQSSRKFKQKCAACSNTNKKCMFSLDKQQNTKQDKKDSRNFSHNTDAALKEERCQHKHNA